MAWRVKLSASAEKELRRVPRDRQARVIRAFDEMEIDQFSGDVKPLKGPEWKGRYRKRVGPYRIIFTVGAADKTVGVSAILIRSEKTYR